MLRCKNLPQLRVNAAMQLSIEMAAKIIVNSLFGKELIVASVAAHSAANTPAHQIYLRWCDGREFGIALTLPSENAPKELQTFVALGPLSQSLYVAKKLNLRCGCGRKYCGRLIESPTQKLTNLHNFSLRSSHIINWSGELIVIEKNGLPFEAECAKGTTDATKGLNSKLTLWAEGYMTDALCVGTLISMQKFWLRGGTSTERIALSLCQDDNGSFYYLINRGENMEENQNAVCAARITLSLGEIELALVDLLELKPGSVIELDRPKQFEAALLIDGVAWAEALLEVGENESQLKIIKLINSVNETSHIRAAGDLQG